MVMGSLDKSPLKFFRTSMLLEFAGKRASNLSELLEGIQTVDDLSIIYHMITPLFMSHQLISNRTNDFSIYVEEILQEKELGEHLTALDPYYIKNISALRTQLESGVRKFLSESPDILQDYRRTKFNFHTITRIVFPTRFIATNLSELSIILEQVDSSCIYHHFVEPRVGIRVPLDEQEFVDDFSQWIAINTDNIDIAHRLNAFDPYLHTLEEIRHAILSILATETGGNLQ